VTLLARRDGFWLLVASLFFSSAAFAAPPAGQSALLNGMHDMESLTWMQSATAGCDKGWITDLQYIGSSGSASGNCHQAAIKAGVSVIQRLDVSGPDAVPKTSGAIAGYAGAFASFVSKCNDIHVWIVGNEPNVSAQKSDPDCTANLYADAYVAVYNKVHAIAGHKNDLLLVASNSPYSPGCLHSLRMIIRRIKAKGVTPDGFALHAYTRATNAATLTSAIVTDNKRQNDGTIDECPGGATWNDTWFSHFRIYRDYIALIEAEGLAGKDVFITESGNACDVKKGNLCYPDQDIGYFQALYGEANAHNVAATTKTKIRAITPYRWTINDDGTGRDFAIGKRSKLLVDLKTAFAKGYAWTQKKSCGQTSSCTQDDTCKGQTICDLTAGKCAATKPCVGGSCAGAELCRAGQGDCVPEHRGVAKLDVAPNAPAPNASITLTAAASAGYTNIGMALEGPAGKRSLSGVKIGNSGGLHTWSYQTTVGAAGIYRATFLADPAASTVYAIRYFRVGDPPPPPDAKVGPNDAAPPMADIPKLQTDSAPTGANGSGCGCRTSAEDEIPPLGICLVLFFFRRRKRRSACG